MRDNVLIYEPVESSIAIEAYYTVGGERRNSGKSVLTLNSIETHEMNKTVDHILYHDLMGRKINMQPATDGIVLKTTYYTDGTAKKEKVIIRE